MRMQSTEAACGFCATSNALKALGVDASEADVARWVDKVRRTENPGVQGLGEMNLGRALTEAAPKRYRLAARALHFPDAEQAVLALRGALEDGAAAVLAVDPEQDEAGNYAASHWVAAVGRLGSRFLIADSADTELVPSLSPSQLLLRWEIPGPSPTFYCLVIRAGATK